MKLTYRHLTHVRASVAVVAILSITVIAFTAAGVLAIVLPGYHVSVQTAGWQEARLASEAGIDLAMERLNASALNPSSPAADWTEWKNASNEVASGATLAFSNANASSPNASLSGNALVVSPSLYLDNYTISRNTGIPAVADVSVCALYPENLPNNRWFRIRSMGTAALGGPPRVPMDRMDTTLRRLTISGRTRGLIAASDVLTPISEAAIPFPRASRIVEVLARPVRPFEMAMHTEEGLDLANSNGWILDSYDSRDSTKSNPGSPDGGVYPDGALNADGTRKSQGNGNIGTNKENPDNTPYAPLVTADGADVRGNIMTNGGDDTSTEANENVSGADRVDGAITDNFYDPMVPVTVPTAAELPTTKPVPLDGDFRASSTKEVYRVSGDLGPLVVSGTGEIVIIVSGKWDIGSGLGAKVVIPAGIKATVYVGGNVEFHNGEVNSNAQSSKVPGNLVIYGFAPVKADGTRPQLNGDGNPSMIAAFYGPNYDVLLSGTNTWIGAIVANTYAISGGGNGGFHYDEALAGIGFVKKYQIMSYFEDARK